MLTQPVTRRQSLGEYPGTTMLPYQYQTSSVVHILKLLLKNLFSDDLLITHAAPLKETYATMASIYEISCQTDYG